MKRKTIKQRMVTGLAGLFLSGCSIQQARCQTSVPPQIPQSAAWNTALAGGETSSPPDAELLSHWWSVFGDQELTSLEERAFKANLSLRTAQSSILQARANRYSASGGLYPSRDFQWIRHRSSKRDSFRCSEHCQAASIRRIIQQPSTRVGNRISSAHSTRT